MKIERKNMTLKMAEKFEKMRKDMVKIVDDLVYNQMIMAERILQLRGEKSVGTPAKVIVTPVLRRKDSDVLVVEETEVAKTSEKKVAAKRKLKKKLRKERNKAAKEADGKALPVKGRKTLETEPVAEPAKPEKARKKRGKEIAGPKSVKEPVRETNRAGNRLRNSSGRRWKHQTPERPLERQPRDSGLRSDERKRRNRGQSTRK